MEATKHSVPQASSTSSMAAFLASDCTISFLLFLAFSFALLALRSCYASRAPLCILSSLSRLTLASGSWQPGALRVQAVRGLRLGFLVSFGNAVPKHLLELFAGLASLASSLAVRCLRTWEAVGGFSLRCSESMSQDTLVIHCFGSPEELFRPCVDCGKRTGSYCETMLQKGHILWQGGVCLAADRVPAEQWAPEQKTPLCNQCQDDHYACRFCRRVHGCTPPTPE